MKSFLKEQDIWALSITATGRCNCDGSYCHFYARRDRKEYNLDMSDELFDNYCKLIYYIKDKYHKKIQVRFSGGEPLVMGDKLFEYSNRLYEITGITPYVLTNGRLLTSEVIRKSRESHIEAYLVSLENPFDQSDGAPKTIEVLEKIKKLNSDEVNVLPAIMVVKNNAFKDLLKICDFVYENIGMLPSFSELTYQEYEVPKEQELIDLYENVKLIASKYYGKTPIRFFPYISPELYANNQRNYMTELDLDNSIGINSNNIEIVAERLFDKLSCSYIKNPCQETKCDWFDDCRIIKWLWAYTYEKSDITIQEKLDSFCKLKKALNNGLYDGITQQGV